MLHGVCTCNAKKLEAFTRIYKGIFEGCIYLLGVKVVTTANTATSCSLVASYNLACLIGIIDKGHLSVLLLFLYAFFTMCNLVLLRVTSVLPY